MVVVDHNRDMHKATSVVNRKHKAFPERRTKSKREGNLVKDSYDLRGKDGTNSNLNCGNNQLYIKIIQVSVSKTRNNKVRNK